MWFYGMKSIPVLIVAIIVVFGPVVINAVIQPILLVHGGAGNIPEGGIPGKLNGIKRAIERGYRLLIERNSAVDAVEEAVRSMEDDDNFNCGYGSVLTSNGEVEMDAAIMNGYDLAAGCVAVVKDIAHPISLARLLMDKSKYVFLAAEGTRDFAISENVTILPPGALISNKSRTAYEYYKEHNQHQSRHKSKAESDSSQQSVYLPVRSDYPDNIGEYERGTVGAVAIDINGNIAAATSTGGIMGKPPGRVGDSPILGSGTFADRLVAGVSATGDGEFILRFNLAQQIVQRIQYDNMTAQEATTEALREMGHRVGGLAGAITIDRHANVGVDFISKQMAWGYRQGNLIRYGANRGQIIEEHVNGTKLN